MRMMICFAEEDRREKKKKKSEQAEGEEEVIAGFTQSADSWAIREWALATSTGQVGTTG